MKKYTTVKKTCTVGLRIDQELRDWLVGQAAANTRNISQEAEHLLKIARLMLEQTGDVDALHVVREHLKPYGETKSAPK